MVNIFCKTKLKDTAKKRNKNKTNKLLALIATDIYELFCCECVYHKMCMDPT